MRGANLCNPASGGRCSETSPHAWSKLEDELRPLRLAGNISTCVEQTSGTSRNGVWMQKHLHMRGANFRPHEGSYPSPETSPHAWSKHGIHDINQESCRNISTCVEQTTPLSKLDIIDKKHLHMRGANLIGGLYGT